MALSPVTLMFSGQGTQYFGMCRELYTRCDAFRSHLQYCDALLEPHLGERLTDLLYQDADRRKPFARTFHTNPAVVAVNYAIATTLMELGMKPATLLGYSLGEIVASVFAGVLPFPEALAMVTEIGRLAEELAPPGRMMVILGNETITRRHPELFADVTVACLNTPRNFVVTGAPDRIADLEKRMGERDVAVQVLPVSHGFHSPLIDPVREAYLEMCNRHGSWRAPRTPVFSCVYNRYLTAADFTPEYYWDVIRQPVRFMDSVTTLERAGPSTYVDAGPSGSLATIARSLLSPESQSQSCQVSNPFGMDMRTLNATLTTLGLSGA